MKQKRRWLPFVLFLLLFQALPAAAESKPSGDRVDALIKAMPLEAKAGQVLVGFFRGDSVTPSLRSMIGRIRPGGMVLYSSTGNIVNPDQVTRLTRSLQEAAASADAVPLFIAVDQEGGRVNRLTRGVTVFPGNMALGATADPELAAKAAGVTARELRTLGITVNFAPVADVLLNPANPVIGTRSFGSDPGLVARMACAMVAPAAAEGVLCVAKHFPGHGNTSVDSHYGLPVDDSPLEVLEKFHLAPFGALVKAGVPALMTAHVSVPELDQRNPFPATLLPKTYAVLREKLGFRGLIVTDSLGMKALDRYWSIEETAVLALQAGADLLLLGADPGHDPEELESIHRALVSAVLTDRIPRSRLDEAVRRILKAKEALNILDDPGPRPERLGELGSPENLALAETIARRALTVAWNRFERFPAAEGEKPKILLWPLEKADQASALLGTAPGLKPLFVSLSLRPEDIDGILGGIEGEEPVYVWAGDLGKFPSWKDLAQRLENRAVLLATDSPIGLSLCPKAGAAVAVYSEVPVSLKALGDFLRAPWPPTGRLPLAVPGL